MTFSKLLLLHRLLLCYALHYLQLELSLVFVLGLFVGFAVLRSSGVHLFERLVGAGGEQIGRVVLLVEMLLIGLELKHCRHLLGLKRSPGLLQCKRGDQPRTLILLNLCVFEPLVIALHEFLVSPLLVFYLFVLLP